MKRTNRMQSAIKNISLALTGAALLLGLALLPAKIVRAERAEIPEGVSEGYYNDFSYFKDGVLYLDGEIGVSGSSTSYYCAPNIILPENLEGHKDEITAIVAKEGTVLPSFSCSLFSNLMNCKTIDLKKADASKVETMKAMFDMDDVFNPQLESKLESVDLSGLDASNVTSTQEMFIGCTNLKTLNMTGFKTSNKLTKTLNMFDGLKSLEALDLSSFDTSGNTDFYDMFYGCSSLTTLEFGDNWKTDKGTDFRGIFQNCSSLHTIYTKNEWDFSSCDHEYAYGEYMFTGCSSLVGGAGTVYDANHTDYTYAKIDNGTSSPGYFTSYPSILGELDASSDSFTLKIYIPVEDTTYDYEITFGNSVYDLDYLSDEYFKIIDGKKYCLLKLDCAAKEMTETKKLIVTKSGIEIYNTDISVAKYLKFLLESASHSAYHPIAGSILRYGAAAQIFFNNYDNDPSKLANYGISNAYNIDSLNNISVPQKDFNFENINEALKNTNYEYGGMNIAHGRSAHDDSKNDTDTALMLAFKPSNDGNASETDFGDVANLLVQGKSQTITNLNIVQSIEADRNNKYQIVKIYIPIKYLGEPIFTIGGQELSIIQYMNLACNDTNSKNSDASKNLCKALYGYYTAVKSFSDGQ